MFVARTRRSPSATFAIAAALLLPTVSVLAEPFDPWAHCTRQVSASVEYTCAVNWTGHLYCWGLGGTGLLGNGAAPNSDKPVRVAGLDDVVQVATGDYHACALRSNGTLWCWGANDDGELGNGVSGTGLAVFSPVQATAVGSDVTEVGVGDRYTCVRKTDGTVWCWGYNVNGELGLGFFSNMNPPYNVPTPTEVTALGSDVAQLSVGYVHACALKSSGALWCWGSDGFGELGNGMFGVTTEYASPVPVTPLGENVESMVAGWYVTCAVLKDHSLWCWGAEGESDLGNGQVNGVVATPQFVAGLDHRARLAANGYLHTCAVEDITDRLECWGDLQGSYLYNAFPIVQASNPFPEPVAFPAGRAVDVSIGEAQTCAVRPDGELFCWGANRFGELGVGDTVDRSDPTAVRLTCE